MNSFLVVIAVIIITCVLLNNASFKIGMPVLLAFIFLGILFGNNGLVPIEMTLADREDVGDICTVALIFIMFYGGFGTSWKGTKPVALEAGLLASLGVVITAGLVGVLCHFLLGWEWVESLLMGSVVSSTDAASVFSILRSRKLGLKNNISPLLELESGSNDPCSYMMTIIMLSMIKGEVTVGHTLGLLFSQLGFGVLFGFIIAFSSAFVLEKVRFVTSGFNSLFLVAVALISYALPSLVGGNGYLSAYIVGIVLGNRKFDNKKELVHFFDGITGLMQVIIFFMLGLLAHPANLGRSILPSLAVFMMLFFVARPIAVFSILSCFGTGGFFTKRKYDIKSQLLVSFCGLRGAASIVFAIVATVGNGLLQHDIFNIVFCIVLISIAFQGSLIPKAAKQLDMIDAECDVMKTFSDFSDEVDLQFSLVHVEPGGPWDGKQVRELGIPKDFLLCMVKKQDEGKKVIIPNGNTLLEAGDKVVVCSKGFNSASRIKIIKHVLNDRDDEVGRYVRDLSYDKAQVLMIQRPGTNKTIIPHGSTKLEPGDIIYINQSL